MNVHQLNWNDGAVRQLRDAIGRRAARGRDRMQFAVDGHTGTADGDRALTPSALRYAWALDRGA